MKARRLESRAAYVVCAYSLYGSPYKQNSIIGHEGTGMCPGRQWQRAGFEAQASGQCTEMKVGTDRETEEKRNREINKGKGKRNDRHK
jgi:hypothetical protein